MRNTPNHTPVVARLSVPLAERNQGSKCALSTVADSRRSATAKGLHGKMANLLRFAPFRVKLKIFLRTMEYP